MACKPPRTRAKKGPAFIFVDSSGVIPIRNAAPEVRTAVRRQAARSGRGSLRPNIQADDVEENQSSEQSEAQAISNTLQPSDLRTERGKPRLTRPSDSSPKISPRPLLTGYESLRARYNFDIINLASFVEVDLANHAHQTLRDEPTWWEGVLKKSSSSFLDHLPSRYGSSHCLDDAIHCVIARAGQMVGAPIKQKIIDSLYGKALESLQKEIRRDSGHPTADNYGAARLLVLYEILGQPYVNRLVTHHRGSIRLLELRRDALYSSAFERALLKGQGPSVLVDELYRLEASIFEKQEWQDLFHHASRVETNHDSSFWWKIFAVTSFLPGILKDLRCLFQDEAYRHGSADWSSKILERATLMHHGLHENNVLYQYKAPHPASLFALPVATESSDRIRLREFFLYTMIYICRIRSTLLAEEVERATSEVEAQTFAAQAVLIERTTKTLDATMAWHFEQRNDLAQSVINSRSDWLSDKGREESQKLNSFLADRWLKWEDSWRERVLKVEYDIDHS